MIGEVIPLLFAALFAALVVKVFSPVAPHLGIPFSGEVSSDDAYAEAKLQRKPMRWFEWVLLGLFVLAIFLMLALFVSAYDKWNCRINGAC